MRESNEAITGAERVSALRHKQVQFLLRSGSGAGGDSRPVVRSAFVAVKDHDTQQAKLVAFFAWAACADSADGICHGVAILQKIPVGNGGTPDQPQLGGG